MIRNHAMNASSPQQNVEDPWYNAESPEPVNSNNNFNGYNNNNSGGYTSNFGPPQSAGNMGSPMTNNSYNNSSTMSMGAVPSYTSSGTDGEIDYENEPPLLEELGVRFDHIHIKTLAVINVKEPLSDVILDDTDLAGPIVFCLLLGGCLLLTGKVHFGYIYGFSVVGCMGLHGILDLLQPNSIAMNSNFQQQAPQGQVGYEGGQGQYNLGQQAGAPPAVHTAVTIWHTCSILGYSLLPIVGLSALAIVFPLKGGLLGTLLSMGAIGWSTYSATRMFNSKLHFTEQFWLVAYPTMLLYSCFVLITIC